MTTRFADTGDVRVTVQAACGNSVLQASKLVRVLGEPPPQGWAHVCPSRERRGRVTSCGVRGRVGAQQAREGSQ